MEESNFDIAIVGSGLGGLACGSILSQRGYKVCILEKHFQVGGCLHHFKRNGVLFDTGMHYFGSYDDGQILNTLFRYFDIYDKVDVIKLDKDCFDTLSVGGKEYQIPQGIDAYRKMLIDNFPQEEKAINLYIDKLQEIYDAVDIVNLREVSSDIMPIKKGADESVHAFVTSITNNKELQNVLCMFNSLYAGKKESASLFEHAVINLFYIQSAYKLAKGGGQLAAALKQVVEENGGCVRIKSKVDKLVCENGSVKHLRLESGEQITAKYFISNIDPLATMQMLEGGNIRKAYVKRLQNQEQTISCFSVYVVLKKRTFKYSNSNLYYYKGNDVWGLDNYSADNWPVGYMMYSRKDNDYPEYAEGLIFLSPMEYSEMEPWVDTTVENRGESYTQMKDEKSRKLLALVKEKYPDIEDCIEAVYTSSPLSFRDYTGVRNGSMYGVAKDYRNPFESQIMPRTRIDNLFLTGQNINMHGAIGVSMGAILTCGEIDGINNIIRDLKSKQKVNGN